MLLDENVGRRAFLRGLGTAGLAGMMPPLPLSGDVMYEVAAPNPPLPKNSVNFAVCGMSHDHIYGMVGAVQRGGGTLVTAYGAEPDKIEAFKKRFPDVKWARSEDEILEDAGIQLVLSSTIPNERAQLGIRVMKHGKDYLSDKPGMTTLTDLDAVRRTIAETKRIYGILYSERLEVKAAVKAGELIRAGAIGKVIQTINIAPHQINQNTGGDAGGSSGRPEWFWHPKQYGGILCDIGSHQVDQFLYYTGSTHAEVAESQVANVRHPDHPEFQDFGDMVFRGNRGFGYIRLDWFTPRGLGTWGDGRLFVLGTEGYMELRKYTNVTVNKEGNHLFVVDQKQARYIDCNPLELPFGPQFVADILNRTHIAQDQEQCLLAAELSIRAQAGARKVTIEG